MELTAAMFGGFSGAVVAALCLMRGVPGWAVVAFNSGACALAGGFLAHAPYLPVTTAFVGYGLLSGLAMPVSVLWPLPTIRDYRELWELVRNVGASLVVNAVFCSAFALNGFLVVYGAITLYRVW